MQILSNITIIVRRVGLFALVLAILAVVARMEPGRQQTTNGPLFAKIFKSKTVSGESSGWLKFTGWGSKG